MDYAVYIYGGGKILWTIFNGISLIFASDNPYFTSVGTLTIGIALLYTGVRSVPGGSLPIFFKEWILPTFLLVALFYGPKASVNIIDKVDLNFKYSKVDNIPLGIAAVASLSSTISEFLTEHIETIFTSSDMERFSRVGPMFGAKLIQAAHTLSIRDPLIRENLKDFTRQCFAWPYVFSNLEPGKKAALETEDMLGFIEANPHPLLGIYWRQPNGQSAFMNCRECAVRV
ncbi:MAG: conjugal transfer protein TraG N-terminal domain-containing protein, partial [Alphaproteobacteria bacterium]|nr:conjugal transfer protein TraG N-terminal domain-containing protein [Alphaproteobacteria bacterium]